MFPLPIFIPLTAPQSPSSIIWVWHNRPVVAAELSELSLTPTIRIVLEWKRGAEGKHMDYTLVGTLLKGEIL